MGLGGVAGPFKGAYLQLGFSTPSVGPGVPGVGAQQINMWSWNAPFDLEIVDIQVWAASIAGGVKVNVLAGGASVLDNTVNSATTQGIAIGQSGVFFGAGASVTLTPSTGIFGTTATSITNTVTPSTPGSVINRGKPYGAYVMAGASISATLSTPAGPSGNVTNLVGTIICYPRTHPASLRSGTE